MPDDQNTTQNPTSEENPSPTSSQESTEAASENGVHSEPAEATEEPQEAQGSDFEPIVESENVPGNEEIQQNQAQNDQTPQTDENSSPEPETAQIPVNEPLEEPETSRREQAEPVRENSKRFLARELLITARNAIQFRKRKKLDRVMSLFLKQSKITNDEVEKLLHVSDATATRYLSQLEKEGKIKQSGKTGKGVKYEKL